MSVKTIKVIAVVFVLALILPVLVAEAIKSSATEESNFNTGRGNAETLLSKYEAWEKEYVKKVGEGNLALALEPSKVFSTEKFGATGEATISLQSGKVAVKVIGLPAAQEWDVWIIDNVSTSGLTVMPEEGDQMTRVGTLQSENGAARLEAQLDAETLATLDPDLITITRSGKSPVESRALVGMMSVYHEMYLSRQQGHFGMLNDMPPSANEGEPGLLTQLGATLDPTAEAQIGPLPPPLTPLQQLITDGRKSFFNETFEGNGRTCGTCHRENDNMTIGVEFIASLPIQDPLFAAETQPALAANFENPVLMRNFALILENVDGFGNLSQRFAMRGIPHTLALNPNTLAPAAIDGSTIPPNERTGWSGDGAPVGPFTLFDGSAHQALGTLRDFIIGAIIQHYPRTLARQPFTFPGLPFDFRLPTQAELNALEAFQKSLGRRLDPDLSVLQLRGIIPARGQQIFNAGTFGVPQLGAGKCFLCHFNAGASFNGLHNANFNTGVENLPDLPADLAGQPNPDDGGFGSGGVPPNLPCPPGGCGNGTFNTPVLVEAADTGGFFHNNAVDTIEGSVAFYNSQAFNNSPSGQVIGGINLEATQTVAVAAFLRVLNTLENVRSAGDLEKRAILSTLNPGRELIRLSIAELTDALEVLGAANLHPIAQQKITQALNLDNQALSTTNLATRNNLLNQALTLKKQAVDDMVVVNVPAFQF